MPPTTGEAWPCSGLMAMSPEVPLDRNLLSPTHLGQPWALEPEGSPQQVPVYPQVPGEGAAKIVCSWACCSLQAGHS